MKRARGVVMQGEQTGEVRTQRRTNGDVPLAFPMVRRRARRGERLFVVWSILWVLGVSACGQKPHVEYPDGPSEETIDLDMELVLRHGEDVRMVRPEVLFEESTKQLAAKEYEACARGFDVLWQALPGSPYEVPSLYNGGLCHERLSHWEVAAERYLLLIDVAAGTSDALDARFRLAEVDANTGRWDRVATVMQTVLGREELRHIDLVEAHYRLGMAEIALRDYTAAEESFKAVLNNNRAAGTRRLPGRNYFISGSTYGMALVYHMLFGEIRFRLPQEQIEKDMQDKIQLGSQAYSYYMKTIRFKDHFWIVNSGYMIGKLFEDFYYDVLTAEIPPDLGPEMIDGYFFSLREELRPLLMRALEAYEKTSAVSERIGVDNEWAALTADRMERLRAYMGDADGFAREEQAIVEWHLQRAEIEAGRAHSPNGEDFPAAPPLALPSAKSAAPQPVTE